MPHIEVKMFPGRDEETKKVFAEKTIKAASEALGTPIDAFSLSIEEVNPDNWNTDIADKVETKSIYAGKVFRK